MESDTISSLTTEGITSILTDRDENNKGRAREATANDLIHRYHFATMRDTKQLMVYENGYYQLDGEAVVASEVKRLWVNQHTRTDIQEIIESHIKPSTYVDRSEFNYDLSKTNLKNGVYDFVDKILLPHDPKYKFTFQLPFDHDKEAKCEEFKRYLHEVVSDPVDVDTILEVFAYCLHRRYPKAKIITLIGEGSNSKSVLLAVLRYFLGSENVRGMSMQRLEHDQFAMSQLYGVHANINPDVGAKKIRTEGAIKSLTGGSDEIDSNVKFKSNMKYYSFCKLIFGTNALPQSDDVTHAWSRRWLFLMFKHIFEKGVVCPFCHTVHDVKPDLAELLKLELPGIFNEVVLAYDRLSGNKWEFTMSESVKKMEHEYHALSDPVAGFVQDCIIEDETSTVPKGDVYDAYRRYCDDIDERPLSGNVFSTRLKQHLPNVTEPRTGQQRRWHGIKLSDFAQQVQLDANDNPSGGVSPNILRRIVH